MSQPALQAALASAQQALIDLSTGVKAATVSYAMGGETRRVTYSRTEGGRAPADSGIAAGTRYARGQPARDRRSVSVTVCYSVTAVAAHVESGVAAAVAGIARSRPQCMRGAGVRRRARALTGLRTTMTGLPPWFCGAMDSRFRGNDG
jgi:hypothetical protein